MCIARDLRVMDAAAVSLCRDNGLPIIVLNINERGRWRGRFGGARSARWSAEPGALRISLAQPWSRTWGGEMPTRRDAEANMEKAIEALRREFSSVRTGKASPALLDTVRCRCVRLEDGAEPGGIGERRSRGCSSCSRGTRA
jgi:hypothetical protein